MNDYNIIIYIVFQVNTINNTSCIYDLELKGLFIYFEYTNYIGTYSF